QHQLDALRVLEVDADRPAPAVQRLEVRLGERCGVDLLGPVDADDVGAHVGEQHPGERARPDAGPLADLHALQRSHDNPPPARSTERPGYGRPDAGVSSSQLTPSDDGAAHPSGAPTHHEMMDLSALSVRKSLHLMEWVATL